MQVLAVLPKEDVQEREWNNHVLVFPMCVCVSHWILWVEGDEGAFCQV